MKDKILFAIALMCTMLLTSCGGSDSGGSSSDGGGVPSRPSTYYMDVIADASAISPQTIELSNLNTNVSTAVSSVPWLNVSRESYTSGSPKITIEATANTATSGRNGTITVTATDGNKVIVTVMQKGTSQTSGLPQTNDEVSDQQPYSMEVGL